MRGTTPGSFKAASRFGGARPRRGNPEPAGTVESTSETLEVSEGAEAPNGGWHTSEGHEGTKTVATPASSRRGRDPGGQRTPRVFLTGDRQAGWVRSVNAESEVQEAHLMG